MKEHWRHPGYWRWLWEARVSRETKGMLVALLCISLAIGGYLSAGQLNDEPEVAAITNKLVTVVRKAPGGMTTEVVTETDLVTRSRTETDLVTVVRDEETVVLRRPGRTLTETVRGKVVTQQVTDTAVRTNTVDRPTTTTVTGPEVTVTGPGQTTTATRDVPGPERTVTETETTTETTALIVHTVTVTVTETVTVTGDSD